jgi:hypothetical protein
LKTERLNGFVRYYRCKFVVLSAHLAVMLDHEGVLPHAPSPGELRADPALAADFAADFADTAARPRGLTCSAVLAEAARPQL